MELSYTLLSEAQLRDALPALSLWTVTDAKLERVVKLDHYLAAFPLAARIGELAEELNHHPDLLIGYQRLTIRTETHDAGGLTSYDFELARRIESYITQSSTRP